VSCRDGFVDPPEECDDGNDVAGDGCDPACLVEPGVACALEPSVCSIGWTCILPYWVDGVCDCGCAVPDPDCVDVDNVLGCYNNCAPLTVDPDDFTQCLPSLCGDGIVAIDEPCDDTDVLAGDGCDGDCLVEPGFACIGQPSYCFPLVCGDGSALGTEECDDGNDVVGDGCADCVVEDGYGCGGTPSFCIAVVCGNGVIELGEACDDANVNAGDGCDASCAVEPSSFCQGEPSVCFVVPAGWTCPLGFYDEGGQGLGPLCDCGCAVFDPDCPATTSDVCEYCDDPGSCSTVAGCPGDISPVDNTQCVL
jgi:cysteine-rich repeat protein